MKKTLIAVLLASLVSSAQAAQINWGLTGPIQYDGVSVADNATLTLVYLSDSSKWSSAAADLASGKDSEFATSVATKNTNASGVSVATASPWIFSWTADGGTPNLASKIIDKGSDFAVLVTTTQGGKDYYWASQVYNVTDSGSNWNGTKTTYTMSQTAASGPNNNWTAVPEPSTAALALAGLALLIKRRRA